MPVFAKLRGRTSPEEATDDIDLSITATRATLGRPTTVGGASATEGLFLGISAHKSISRAHAQVSWDGRAKPSGKWSIVCLSKNGMTVDKFYWGKGETAALEHHSAVKIGRSMFYFVLPGAPAPAADPAAAPAAAAAPPTAAAAPPAAAAAAAAAAADEPVVKVRSPRAMHTRRRVALRLTPAPHTAQGWRQGRIRRAGGRGLPGAGPARGHHPCGDCGADHQHRPVVREEGAATATTTPTTATTTAAAVILLRARYCYPIPPTITLLLTG